ncbi:E3 ubiquitin-protein ligase RSL1-like [Vicia villosa]|uniref:E3 ubiquitin-protein ligase RSL1-like n=1 Tax=Vicia villosa TaxID=3911 RepID=UPI00273B5C04|nr:E3 ubiquitin-protein ligase RSL1-like [Vicia villosa]
MKEAFYIEACSHTYCSECVVMYIDSNLQNNISNIRCPFIGCTGLLEIDSCRRILPAEIFDRWGQASCEAMFDASVKVYCPFADCSALLIKDSKEEVLGRSKCPNCKRMLCAECKVSWHEGMECSEFEKMNADEKDDEGVMLMSLAKDMGWRRCPNCRFYVARSEGVDVDFVTNVEIFSCPKFLKTCAVAPSGAGPARTFQQFLTSERLVARIAYRLRCHLYSQH